jgi:hypothetical protein
LHSCENSESPDRKRIMEEMVSSPDLKLKERRTQGAQVTRSGPAAWRLEIPAGPAGQYRLAQLDDYAHLPRGAFPWHPPLTLSLRGCASAVDLPGTWGFGLWNDPFGLAFVKGGGLRLPSLPTQPGFSSYRRPIIYLCATTCQQGQLRRLSARRAGRPPAARRTRLMIL